MQTWKKKKPQKFPDICKNIKGKHYFSLSLFFFPPFFFFYGKQEVGSKGN